MQIAFGVFANAKIQCEESVSSSTPQNLASRGEVLDPIVSKYFWVLL